MRPTIGLDVADTESLLDALLQRAPLPSLYATDARGIIVPMPDSVPISNRQSVIHGHSTILEILEPGDIAAVCSAWYSAIETGAAKAFVHLLHEPNNSAVLQLIDARQRYGVFLNFIIGREAAVLRPAAKGELFHKRLCYVERDAQGTFIAADDAVGEVLGRPHRQKNP